MSYRGSLFSYWQLKEKQMMFRFFNKGDVVCEQHKLALIEANSANIVGIRMKRLRVKVEKRIHKNVSFFCQMINQEILENSGTRCVGSVVLE